MEYTMQLVMIHGTHVSGIDVSVDRSGWRERGCSVALDAFPTVNGTGVSARGRPRLGAHSGRSSRAADLTGIRGPLSFVHPTHEEVVRC